MRKLGYGLALALLAVMCAALPASAGWTWCRTDPIVRLNGTDVQIIVAVPAFYTPLVNGPVDVKVYVPDGVSTELVMTDAGFNGYGEAVTFAQRDGSIAADGSFPVSLRVRVPIDATGLAPGKLVPVMITVTTSTGVVQVVSGNHTATTTEFTLGGN